MHNKLTDAEIVQRLRIMRDMEGKPKDEIAAACGIAGSMLRTTRREAEARSLTADTVVVDPIASLTAENKVLKAALRATQKDQDTAAKIREEIYELAARTPKPPKWLVREGTAGHRGTPFLMCSDWHFGETVKPEEVGGVNEFNTEIAIARAEKLFKSAVALSFEHMGRASVKYPGIICALGGDMVTGEIHPDLIDTDRRVLESLNDVEESLIAGITLLADHFGFVYVPCVPGNHGRNTLKRRTSAYVHTNYEWHLYCSLEKHFRRLGDIRVQFDIPDETDCHFRSYGHRYCLTHGDNLGVKGGDGMIGALGPIMRGTIKVGRSEAQIGRDFDTLVMGHWHQKIIGPNNCVVVNNALKGYDTYARLQMRAPYTVPSQALFFTHPEHGITAHWDIFLDKKRGATDNKKWLEFQK